MFDLSNEKKKPLNDGYFSFIYSLIIEYLLCPRHHAGYLSIRNKNPCLYEA